MNYLSLHQLPPFTKIHSLSPFPHLSLTPSIQSGSYHHSTETASSNVKNKLLPAVSEECLFSLPLSPLSVTILTIPLKIFLPLIFKSSVSSDCHTIFEPYFLRLLLTSTLQILTIPAVPTQALSGNLIVKLSL